MHEDGLAPNSAMPSAGIPLTEKLDTFSSKFIGMSSVFYILGGLEKSL